MVFFIASAQKFPMCREDIVLGTLFKHNVKLKLLLTKQKICRGVNSDIL
jgi:hypothetical protein